MLDPLASQLERFMSVLVARQSLVSANIANADTPGYKTVDVDFQAELRRQLGGSGPVRVEVEGLQVKNDGNNVSIDREARLLAENSLRFNIAAQILRSQIRTMRAAIQEGRNS